MAVHCKNCGYDLDGLSGRARCPECGGRRRKVVHPYDWSRFRGWPGVMVIAGLLLLAAGALVWSLSGMPLIVPIGIMAEGLVLILVALIGWG